jgi:hypothetical protein
MIPKFSDALSQPNNVDASGAWVIRPGSVRIPSGQQSPCQDFILDATLVSVAVRSGDSVMKGLGEAWRAGLAWRAQRAALLREAAQQSTNAEHRALTARELIRMAQSALAASESRS